ncbi:MAG: molybdopterin-dependent oxidoreductase [Blautia sp.]|nr:molybdopterin-dependent oxidoreductase [Blautia sp.]
MIEDLLNAKFSRRDFLKGTVAATAAVAGLRIAGGGENRLYAAEEDTAPAGAPIVNDAAEDGKWVAAPCWHNCGGKCLVRAYVKDGVIVRQGTDDFNTDDDVNRQQRACLRGFSQQYQARGLDRLKYPMKRKNWSPDNPNPELRGQDEWERISWDEAAAYIHDEVERINSTYGDNSILTFGGGCSSLLNKLDINYLTTWTTSSWGTWFAPGVLGWGDGCNYYDCQNDRLDFMNCDYVVAFGYNPAWSSLGNATNYALSWKKAGAKFIIFDPIYTDTSAILDAQWVPIRPGTDMAAMMAMSYVLLEEDQDGSLIDWDFLDRCCLGQDKDHMPSDVKSDENYFDYLRGEYDGIPKTPEWAEELCGVPADTLREVARILGKDNNVAILSSWASARTYDTEQLPQTAICLGAMGGHIGKSGNSVGPTAWNHTNNFGPRLVKAGSGGSSGATGGSGAATLICDNQVWKAVKGEPFNPTAIWNDLNEAGPDGWKDVVAGYDLTKRVEYITAPIKMIWTTNKAKLTTCEGAKEGVEAMRSVEFVVGQGHFLTATNKYADIVLPITTNWEREGSYVWEGYMNRDILLINRGMLDPFFESKSDEEAMICIGEKFGLAPEMWGTVSEKQRLFNAVATSTVIKEDGQSWENLVSVTEEDIEEWGVDGQPQEGRIPIAKYMADGLYRVDRHIGDNFGFIHKKEFRDDPEGHPISTSTGKIEFASQSWADILNSQGYSEEEYSAIPKYRVPTQGYEDTFVDRELGGEKTAYPLQCINPHYQRRSHSIFDNVPWLREVCPNPVFLAKKDAQERGIAEGDTVKISSVYGETLRKAYLTARLMPGVVGLPHGPWIRVDESTGIDQSGSENYITGQVARGLGCSGYNTLNVEVVKYDEEIPDDVEIPQTILFE